MGEVYPPDGIDLAWWAEKTQNIALDYCPRCRADVDPRDSHFVPVPCSDHRNDVGSADARAAEKRPVVVVYVPDSDAL